MPGERVAKRGADGIYRYEFGSVIEAVRDALDDYRGAAALALADVLTRRGINVGITLFYSTKLPTDMVSQAVVRYSAKDPLMPLDISAVALAMCEIAFFRVICAIGSMRHFPGAVNKSLGVVTNLLQADHNSVDYMIDADVFGEQAAEAWLRSCLHIYELEAANV